MATYGVKDLRRIILMRETTAAPGTLSTQSGTLWRGEGVLTRDDLVVLPSEDVGLLSDTDRAYIPMVAASLALAQTPATFEQLPYLGEMGVQFTTAGTSDGSGSDYIYPYIFATSAQKNIVSYSIQAGDNVLMEQALYAYCSDFELSGKVNEAVMMQGTLKMRTSSTIAAYSTGAAIPTVESILFNKGKLYIDSSSTGPGGSTAQVTWLGFDLKVKTGFVGQVTADGQLYFTFVKQVKPEITLDLTFEMDSTLATAERQKWLTKATRILRMDFAGNALTTTGTAYATKLLRIDLAGVYTKFSALTDSNGDDTIVASLTARYNSAQTLFASMTIVNELATLPT